MRAEDLAFDMLSDEAESGFATDESWRSRLRRLQIIARIVGMLRPSPMPALPPPEPPPAIVDTTPTAGAGAGPDPPDPNSRQRTEAMLEHLGRVAASSESDERAEAALGASIPLMRRLAGPAAAAAVRRAAPRVRQAVVRGGAMLRRDPSTRRLAALLPIALARVARRLRRRARGGAAPTPRQVMAMTAHELRRLLSRPAAARRLTRQHNPRACPMCQRRTARRGAGCGCGAHGL